MFRQFRAAGRQIDRFVSREDGVATVDWVIVASGATGAAMIALSLGQQSMGGYSAGVRDEVQSPYFETSWTESLPIPPEDTWGEQDPITPNYGTGGGGVLDDFLTPGGTGGTDPDDGSGGSDDDTGVGTGAGTGGGTGTGGTGGSGPLIPVETPIVVANASFEQTNHGNGGWSSGVPGWTTQTNGSGDVGDFNPGSSSVQSSTVTGDNVVYMYQGGYGAAASISQTFDEVYSATATYTVSVDIGDGAYWPSFDESYQLNIYAGSTLIGSETGTTGDIDALETVTVTSTVQNPALNGQPIRFEIVHTTSGAGELLVDNVVATVTNQVPSGGVTPPAPTGPQVVSGVIQGCPSMDYIADPIRTTADALEDDDLKLDVTASGSTNIASCGALSALGFEGFFNANPTVTLDLSGFDNSWDRFEIKTDRECDTAILVLDAQGNWYEGNVDRRDRRLRIEDDLANLNGLVSIWVGMENGGTCTGEELKIKADD